MRSLLLILITLILFSFTSDTNPELFLKVHKKGYYYFANKKGKMMIKEKFTSASWFSEGLAVATTDEKYGIIDTDGNWVLEEKYYDIGDFHEGLAWYRVSNTSKYGYLNSKGDKAILMEFESVNDFKYGYAVVGVENDDTLKLGDRKYKFYLINKKNERLLDSAFSSINYTRDSTYKCYLRKDMYEFNLNGELVSVSIHKDREKVDSTDTSIDSTESFSFVEVMPSFPGGDEERIDYIVNNIFYPSIAKEKGIEGIVYISFIVEKDGSVTNVKVLRSPHPFLAKESARIVRSFPKWIPGEQRGKRVRAQFNMPFRYVLSN